eukprot:TRINITY_DN2377_c0_g1_i1.p1 TRINITY_DN2377_c0_g1~~TRINITY_DN2377_c0_g1_i1.p1  ORF type:complete len:580 (-),score=162.90 TRINITY_DN2377_c0_g1_i1:5-1744(-)
MLSLNNIIVSIILVCMCVSAHSLDLYDSDSRRIDGIKLISSAYITLNTSTLTGSGQWISIEWGGVPNPDDKDTIQVFAPSNANFTSHAPVKYAKCSDLTTKYDKTGSGGADVILYNLRMDHIIVLVNEHYIIAMSDPISFTNYNEPLQGHLSLTQAPSVMTLTWTSLHSSSPSVQWGEKSGQYTEQAQATTNTYTQEDMCGSPASDIGWYNPGLIHSAYLSNLVPNQEYFYVYGDSDGWSDEFSFLGPKTESSTSVHLIAYGDMGRQEPDSFKEHEIEPGSEDTMQHVTQAILSSPYDAILHIGDISYASGFGSEWDAFFAQIMPMATKVPYMVCPGNHEFNSPDAFWINATDSGGECGVPYRSRFNMPLHSMAEIGHQQQQQQQQQQGAGAGGFNASNNWYSVNIGPIHVLMINTEEYFETESPQLQFIEEDLSHVNRSETPFILVGGHRPMYVDSRYDIPSNFSDQQVAELLREYVEPSLYKYKVDVAIWGHHHSYQRTCQVYNQQCVEDGIVHMVIGTGGHSLSHNLEEIPPSWIKFTDVKDYGYLQIDVTEKTMTVSYMAEKTAKDSFTLDCKFC